MLRLVFNEEGLLIHWLLVVVDNAQVHPLDGLDVHISQILLLACLLFKFLRCGHLFISLRLRLKVSHLDASEVFRRGDWRAVTNIDIVEVWLINDAIRAMRCRQVRMEIFYYKRVLSLIFQSKAWLAGLVIPETSFNRLTLVLIQLELVRHLVDE